jgi:hypothetical protein
VTAIHALVADSINSAGRYPSIIKLKSLRWAENVTHMWKRGMNIGAWRENQKQRER